MKPQQVREEYAEGVRFESIVTEMLRRKGYDVRAATTEENIVDDIDLYFRKGSMSWTSASVKTNQPKYFDSPFCFEQQQVRRGQMVDSWWRTGKAKVYLVLKRDYSGGGKLWLLGKSALQDYVTLVGWDADNVGISDERLAVQRLNNMGNSVLGLIKQETVVQHRLGQVLTSTTDLKRYDSTDICYKRAESCG